MVWSQCNPKFAYQRLCDYLLRNQCWRELPVRNYDKSSGSNRRHNYHRNYRPNLYRYFLVSLLAVTPAIANEDPTVNNTSNPVAAATGNVTNQAVMFQNNGAPSRQYFGPNSSCNGTTMQVSPFYMGSDTIPTDSTYTRTGNWGMQINFAVPLDGGMIELCKSIARKHEQKLRLDYEIVRALKCAELQQKGFTFRPGTRVESLCSDIVPIVSLND